MTRSRGILMRCSLITLLILAFFPLTASANVNLLVIGEDGGAEAESVPQSSRVFRRVINAIQREMKGQDVSVRDETLLTADTNIADNCDTDKASSRRSRAEILCVADAITEHPIDIATNFQIYYYGIENSASVTLNVRVAGEVLHVKNKEYLASYDDEFSQVAFEIPKQCFAIRECTLEKIGENAKAIARQMSKILSKELAGMIEGGLSNSYKLVFVDFDPSEVRLVERELRHFTGYEGQRKLSSTPVESVVRYEGTTEQFELEDLLSRQLESLDLEFVLNMNSDNELTIQKLRVKKQKDNSW